MEERLRTDCICMDVMVNAYEFVLGEIDVNEFISAHNFFGIWFFDYGTGKSSLLNAMFIMEVDLFINVTDHLIQKSSEISLVSAF